MAKGEGYQGWKNYETWLVSLWIDNERSSYDYWREVAKEAKLMGTTHANVPKTWSKKEAARFLLADRLKSEFEEAKEGIMEKAGQSASFWSDMLGAALEEVSWDEIAKNLLEE